MNVKLVSYLILFFKMVMTFVQLIKLIHNMNLSINLIRCLQQSVDISSYVYLHLVYTQVFEPLIHLILCLWPGIYIITLGNIAIQVLAVVYCTICWFCRKWVYWQLGVAIKEIRFALYLGGGCFFSSFYFLFFACFEYVVILSHK